MKTPFILTPNSASVTLVYPSASGVIEAAMGQGHDFYLVSSTVMSQDFRHTISSAKACLAALRKCHIDSDMAVKTWEQEGQACWRFGVIVRRGRKSRWRLYHFTTSRTHLHFEAMLAAQAEAATLHTDLVSLAPRDETRSQLGRRAPRL